MFDAERRRTGEAQNNRQILWLETLLPGTESPVEKCIFKDSFLPGCYSVATVGGFGGDKFGDDCVSKKFSGLI